MAYAQWVTITIDAIDVTLSVKHATYQWGKFYQIPNKDDEVSIETINEMVIPAGGSNVIAACGRENASSGTEGSFELYDGDTLIGEYYWDCPWGSKTNTSLWKPNDTVLEQYVTQVTGANLDSGALGNLTIKCVKL